MATKKGGYSMVDVGVIKLNVTTPQTIGGDGFSGLLKAAKSGKPVLVTGIYQAAHVYGPLYMPTYVVNDGAAIVGLVGGKTVSFSGNGQVVVS